MAELTPPPTFDPWTTVKWLLEHQKDLYVRIMRPKAKPSDPSVGDLVCVQDLHPLSWVFHAKRLHFDSTHQVWTKARWDSWEEQQVADLSDFG